MARTEAISTFSAALAKADEARLAAITAVVAELSSLDTAAVLSVADGLREMQARHGALRQLSPRELDLVAQSKADYAAGRAYGVEEAFARIDAGLAARRAARV